MQVAPKLLLVFMALTTASCISWKRVPGDISQMSPLPSRVRITSESRAIFYVRNGKVEGDSVIGDLGERGRTRFAIPVRYVRRLDVSRVSPARSVLAVVGAVIIGAIVYEAAKPPCRDCIQLF
ncbi:MAG: hypothetical protein ABIS03_09270 [Gemmatimonadaceae bacterium]